MIAASYQHPMTPTAQLALGRIFRLLSRPHLLGDAEQFEAARRVVLAEAEAVGIDTWSRRPATIAPSGWNHGRIGEGTAE